MFAAFIAPKSLTGLKDLPSRLKIGNWGRNEAPDGTGFTINETTAAILPKAHEALSLDTVALDFEHNTCPDKDGNKPTEPIKVAAHGRPEVVPGEGLFIDDIKWTDEGAEAAKGGHYPDLSPAVKMNDQGEVVCLHSAALCRTGKVPTLRLFSAADLLTATQLQRFNAALAPEPTATKPQITPSAMDYKKLLLTLLNLPETATDEQVNEAAQARAQQASAAVQSTEQFSADFKKLSERVDTLTKSLDEAERARLIAEAINAGKVVPHGAEIDKLDTAAFEKLLEMLPAGQVPVEQRTAEGIKAFSAGFAASSPNSAADADVARQMGNSEESLKKYGDKVR